LCAAVFGAGGAAVARGGAAAGFGAAGFNEAGFGAEAFGAAGFGAAAFVAAAGFGAAGFAAPAFGATAFAVAAGFGTADAGRAAEILRVAVFLVDGLAPDLAFVVVRALRAGAFAVFTAGTRFAAVFLAGFFAADFLAVFFAGANIVSFFFSLSALFSFAAFFIFFAMIVLRSLRLYVRYLPGRLNSKCSGYGGTSGIHALGLAAPPDCRIPRSAFGAGPPVAQSINSIGCTTGILVPAAIWMMQPIFPAAITSGSVPSI
jgi:hypothetical protein